METLDSSPNPPHYPSYNYNNLDRVRCLRTALAARNKQISAMEEVIQGLQRELELRKWAEVAGIVPVRDYQ